MTQQLPASVTAPLLLVAGALILWSEFRRPLRSRTNEPKLKRNVRNLAVAAIAGVAVQFAELPLALPLAAMVEERNWGALKLFNLPLWLELPLAVLALDYTLYWWHVFTHRSRLLWRFHLPHHADLDMDASTALRFHFGEIAFSVLWRVAQVVIIGVSPLSFSVWQTGLVIAILFHHSNVRLSPETERRLSRFIVTPGMHAIHHSAVEDETNSNWSSGLSIWDRLHGTYRLDVPQDQITIGIPAYHDLKDVTLPKVLAMPFTKRREDWRTRDGRLLLTRGKEPLERDAIVAPASGPAGPL
jgi:sterol desaturase/sphingolipid hydroxylase (fatty acid hydroxylase superfamily)